jgi:hypothetical protein
MQSTLKHIKHAILFIIAMQILNIGLFAQDFTYHQSPQENIINSVTEYIAEIVCNKKDAFPEQDTSPQKHQTHLGKHIVFKIYASNAITTLAMPVCKKQFIALKNEKEVTLIKDIIPHPPKA